MDTVCGGATVTRVHSSPDTQVATEAGDDDEDILILFMDCTRYGGREAGWPPWCGRLVLESREGRCTTASFHCDRELVDA